MSSQSQQAATARIVSPVCALLLGHNAGPKYIQSNQWVIITGENMFLEAHKGCELNQLWLFSGLEQVSLLFLFFTKMSSKMSVKSSLTLWSHKERCAAVLCE